MQIRRCIFWRNCLIKRVWSTTLSTFFQEIPWHEIFSALHKKKLLLGFGILVQATAFFVPILFGHLVTLLNQEDSAKDSYFLVMGILLLSLLEILMSRENEQTLVQSFYEQEKQLKLLLWKKLESMSFQERERMPTGFWMQKLSRDVAMISGSCRMFFQAGLSFMIFFFGTFFMIVWQIPSMITMFIFAVFSAVFTQRFFYQRIEESTKGTRESFYEEGDTLLNLLEMLPVLKLFRVSSLYTSLFLDKVGNTIQNQIRQQKLTINFQMWIQLEFWMLQSIVLCVCTWLFLQEHLEIGDIVMYDMLMAQMLGGMSQLIFVLPQLAAGWEYARSMRPLLTDSEKSCQEVMEDSIYLNEHRHLFEKKIIFILQNVSFSYEPGKKDLIIRNFSTQIHRGEFVCFLGRNGTGKSTLAKLLLGMERPTTGRIYMMAEQPVVVPQHIVIYPDSLLENIRLRDTSVSTRQVERLLCRCGLGHFLQEKGIHTMLVPGMLSGGELQILGIVRALVRQPELLVLDELTNNLDIVAKETVYLLLKKLAKECTMILITHDTSCLELSDRIFVFQRAGIIEVAENTKEKRVDTAIQMIRKDAGF